MLAVGAVENHGVGGKGLRVRAGPRRRARESNQLAKHSTPTGNGRRQAEKLPRFQPARAHQSPAADQNGPRAQNGRPRAAAVRRRFRRLRQLLVERPWPGRAPLGYRFCYLRPHENFAPRRPAHVQLRRRARPGPYPPGPGSGPYPPQRHGARRGRPPAAGGQRVFENNLRRRDDRLAGAVRLYHCRRGAAAARHHPHWLRNAGSAAGPAGRAAGPTPPPAAREPGFAGRGGDYGRGLRGE